MTKQITLSDGRIVLAVKIRNANPKDIFVHNASTLLGIVWNYGGYTEESGGVDAVDPDIDEIPLPDGAWQILFKTSEVTEEMAKGIVEKIVDFIHLGHRIVYYADYGKLAECDTAIESFATWLEHNGLEGEWVLLEKIK